MFLKLAIFPDRSISGCRSALVGRPLFCSVKVVRDTEIKRHCCWFRKSASSSSRRSIRPRAISYRSRAALTAGRPTPRSDWCSGLGNGRYLDGGEKGPEGTDELLAAGRGLLLELLDELDAQCFGPLPLHVVYFENRIQSANTEILNLLWRPCDFRLVPGFVDGFGPGLPVCDHNLPPVLRFLGEVFLQENLLHKSAISRGLLLGQPLELVQQPTLQQLRNITLIDLQRIDLVDEF